MIIFQTIIFCDHFFFVAMSLFVAMLLLTSHDKDLCSQIVNGSRVL